MAQRRIKIIGIAIVLGIFTFINILAATFIFIDIRAVDMPKTILTVEVFEITTDEAVLKATVLIDNQNPFDVIVKDLKMITKTDTGEEILKFSIPGGDIPSKKNKTFSTDILFSLKNKIPDRLTSEITGTMGIRFFSLITKTLPVQVTVITSLGDSIRSLSMPLIHANIEFDNISKHGVNITTKLDIQNPNSFDLSFDDISITAVTDAGTTVGVVNVASGLLKAHQTTTMQGKGSIQLKALDANVLTVTVNGNVSVHIAGAKKKIPLTVDADINVPHLSDIFALNTPTDMIIKSDMELKGRGFIDHITLEIINPNNLPLEAKDVTFSIYVVANDVEELVGETVIERASVQAKNKTFLKTEISMPFSKILRPKGGGFFPDALLVTVRAKVTIEGLDQWFWLGVSGYQDLHILR
ncbi:MAG: hypothetical protein QXX20_06175 [Candidatus Thermoplasmatota archaeon]